MRLAYNTELPGRSSIVI